MKKKIMAAVLSLAILVGGATVAVGLPSIVHTHSCGKSVHGIQSDGWYAGGQWGHSTMTVTGIPGFYEKVTNVYWRDPWGGWVYNHYHSRWCIGF